MPNLKKSRKVLILQLALQDFGTHNNNTLANPPVELAMKAGAGGGMLTFNIRNVEIRQDFILKAMEGNLSQQLKKSSSFLSTANDAICSAVSKAMSFVGGPQQTVTSGERSLLRKKSSLILDLNLDKESLAEISLDEVSCHDSICDCWIVIYDRVFDVTSFLQQHPGGEEVLMEHAGRDATIAFGGAGHSGEALTTLEKYLIGRLPSKERIYSNGGKKVFDTLTSLSLAS